MDKKQEVKDLYEIQVNKNVCILFVMKKINPLSELNIDVN